MSKGYFFPDTVYISTGRAYLQRRYRRPSDVSIAVR